MNSTVFSPASNVGNHQMRGQALEQLGDDDLALKALAAAARLSDQNSKPIADRVHLRAIGAPGRSA